jgi:copper chaperone CopZ
VEGILEAKVDLENKSGKFKYDSASKVTPDSIVKTIKDLGFTAKLVINLFDFN